MNKISIMPKEKVQRLPLIREVLDQINILNKRELKNILEKRGIQVSHSALSRDLKELVYLRTLLANSSFRVIKVINGKERIELLF